MGLFDLLRRKKKDFFCSAVIVAAGSSSRMGGEDKMTAMLSGEMVIVHTLRAFDRSDVIDEIVLVTREDRLEEMSHIAAAAGIKKLSCVVPGGRERAESSLAGIRAACPDSDLVAIHDGARPLITGDIIEDTVRKAASSGAAIPAIPENDTVKKVSRGMVTGTVERREIYRVQTPQVFDKDIITAALTKAVEQGSNITDDSSAVENIGGRVSIVEGSQDNIKITRPIDLIFAQAVLDRRGEV